MNQKFVIKEIIHLSNHKLLKKTKRTNAAACHGRARFSAGSVGRCRARCPAGSATRRHALPCRLPRRERPRRPPPASSLAVGCEEERGGGGRGGGGRRKRRKGRRGRS
ncbi:hypothetical protein [Oryza sativa Japonica Group]|uniref:Uncharacterized protein n=1 Tax=Oryza sativa subsp. japonica TaxID=39947 RepID=Q5ZBS2_ORYSJ|nr:hypothetical protein [Oryza sativa Japonica Group]BAD68267.1 hypothetical protein [Oryza sativa Japonica Group]